MYWMVSMAQIVEPEAVRVSKKEFQARFARRAGVTTRTAVQVYDAMIDELIELVRNGHRVTLTGFGRFYMQEHKGHKVQFAKEGSVADYAVLKFSQNRDLGKKLRDGLDADVSDSEDEDEE